MSIKQLHTRLPNYQASTKAWEGLQTQLDALDNKEKPSIELRDKTCPDSMWDKLELQLNDIDQPGKQTKLFEKLPKYSCQGGLKLNQATNTKQHWLSIAAAVIILLSIGGTLLLQLSRTKETISYTLTEVIIEENIFEMPEASFNIDFEIILMQFCSEKPQICQNQDYQILNRQLEQIKMEEKNLKALQEMHKDPNINKLIMQLQNDKIQLEKTLLLLF